jgi:choline monooxygenase
VTITLPARAYVDPHLYAAERVHVFARQWQLAAFGAQLREPGDYAAHEFAGWRVLVVRQDDGTLRAFHNVCRHRAGPLVTEPAGHCTNLVCRYHGGATTGTVAPVARDFGSDLDVSEFGLFAVQVEEWRGLVFVNLDPNAPLATDHGAFFAAAADQPFEAFSTATA